MREFKCNRYFVQQDEQTLSELIADGISFETLDEAKLWIDKTDPRKEFAYNVYLIKTEVEYAV